MPTAALYIRLSREDREKPETAESESIKNQQALLIRYCESENIDIAVGVGPCIGTFPASAVVERLEGLARVMSIEKRLIVHLEYGAALAVYLVGKLCVSDVLPDRALAGKQEDIDVVNGN